MHAADGPEVLENSACKLGWRPRPRITSSMYVRPFIRARCESSSVTATAACCRCLVQQRHAGVSSIFLPLKSILTDRSLGLLESRNAVCMIVVRGEAIEWGQVERGAKAGNRIVSRTPSAVRCSPIGTRAQHAHTIPLSPFPTRRHVANFVY